MKKLTKILTLLLLVVLCLTMLVACAPNSDPDKAQASLKEAGYTVVRSDKLAALFLDDLDCLITGTKSVETEDGETKIEHVSIYYFHNAEAAKKAWESIQDESEDEKDDESDWVCKISGKMIYYGTKAAVSAAR